MQNMEWYHSLNKPPLNPPDWIFAPVWTILYITIALSFILYMKGGYSKEKLKGIVLFIIQLILNLIWTPIFFVKQNIILAGIVCILLLIFVLLTIIQFHKSSKISAYLLIPYFLWLLVAAYLNIGIIILNRAIF